MKALHKIVRTRTTGFVLVALLLLLWEASARLGWVASGTWPAFSAVVTATVQELASGRMLRLLGSTFYRMGVGYAAGCGLGVIVGLLLAAIPLLYRFFAPLIEIVRPIPSPAIVPPLILFLGLGDGLKIFLVALASFFPVFVNTVAGVRGTNSVLLQTAATFRVGRASTIRKVLAPAALPVIFSGFRISMAIALVVTVVAEMIAGSGGVGYFIIETQYALRPESMYAAVICLAVLGYALNRGLVFAERRLFAWYGQGQRAED